MDERPPKAHLRIEKPATLPGRPHVVTNDRIMAVAEDGAEVEISRCVSEWREISQVGDVRRIEVVLIGYHVTDLDGSVVYSEVAEPQIRRGRRPSFQLETDPED